MAVYIGATNASSAGWLSAYPSDESDPGLSVLSYSPGEVDRNLDFAQLSSTGGLTITNDGTVAADVIVNVEGYFIGPDASEIGGEFTPLNSSRILDTRNTTPIPANGSVTFQATGNGGVPSSGVNEVVESVAVLGATASGYLSAYSPDVSDPSQPGVNFAAGDQQDNDLDAAIVSSVSSSGKETVTNHSTGTANVVVSVRGYYSAATVPGALTSPAGNINSDGSAWIDWPNLTTDGGAPITGYTVTITNPNGTNFATLSEPGTTSLITLSGFTVSSTYGVIVSAQNGIGSGPAASFSMSENSSITSPCDLSYNPYSMSNEFDEQCGDTISPSTGTTTLSDGGLSTNYDVNGVTMSEYTPPAGFNPLTASASELDLYGMPYPPTADLDDGTSDSTTADLAVQTSQYDTMMSAINPVPATSELISVPVSNAIPATTAANQYKSNIWAGYINGVGSGYNRVGMTYKEPSLGGSICSDDAVSYWDGLGSAEPIIGGTGEGALYQGGTAQGEAGVGYDQAWSEYVPGQDAVPVNLFATEGANFYVRTMVTGNYVKIFYENDHTLRTTTAVYNYAGSGNPPAPDETTAEFIVERPTKGAKGSPLYNLANFNVWHVLDADTNSKPLTNFKYGATTNATPAGRVLSQPSGINTTNGSFSVSQDHCS